MINEEIKKFANITDEELSTIDEIKQTIRIRPSGKLSIQTQALDLDELSVRLCEIIFGLQWQLSYDKLTRDKTMSKYYADKMGLFKEKELFFKFLNEASEESTAYKILILKIDRLTDYIKSLDQLMWIIKSRIETLRISHGTDY